MEKDLADGIKNLSSSLNKHKVKYMFVGGVAISFYGSARPSSNLPRDIDYDIDVWYLATNENFVKLTKSIAEISPELEDELKKIIFDPKKTFKIEFPSAEIRKRLPLPQQNICISSTLYL